MINLLKRAQLLKGQLDSSPKNGQLYSKYHRLFKVLLRSPRTYAAEWWPN